MNTLLDYNNLVIGIEKCFINAESLIDDAILLKANKRIARSYTLFQLALEEIGKASILYFFAISNDTEKVKNLKRFKNEFLNHKFKTEKAINFDILILASLNDKDEKKKFFDLIQSEYASIDKLNNLKNYSLYTSIIDDTFLLPSEIITSDILNEIETRTIFRLDLIKSTLNYFLQNIPSTREIHNQMDDEQIELLANQFMADFLEGNI